MTQGGCFRSRSAITWILDRDGSQSLDSAEQFFFGEVGDKPVIGDWGGIGVSHLGTFRPGDTASWSLDINGDGAWGASDTFVSQGYKTDIPIIADWNQDGRSNLGVYREGRWSIDTNGDDAWDETFSFGMKGDIPIVLVRP